MTRYAAYLALDRLLSLQAPITARTATELTFIVGHQIHELWFKLIIVRLRQAVAAMDGNVVPLAVEGLRNVHWIERLMFEQLFLLERLDPREFGELRAELGNASGAESVQYRLVEQLSRNNEVGGMTERDMWTAFRDLLRREVPVAEVEPDQPSETLLIVEIYGSENPHLRELRELAECMLDHDEGWMSWRFRHRWTAQRNIGHRRGTGGSSGVEFLRRRADRSFYPELWHARGLVAGP